MQKQELRAALSERRAQAAAADPDAGLRLAGHWPVTLSPGVVISGYRRFRSEIDPAPLMAWLAEQGARLCLPVTQENEALTFRAYAPGDPLIKSRFGVLEPADAAALLTPDILLVPLLGFDRAGHRLGYGQGHYDRTLQALRARRPTVAVGVAFAAQEVAALPAEPHDERLDWVLTPDGAIAIP